MPDQSWLGGHPVGGGTMGGKERPYKGKKEQVLSEAVGAKSWGVRKQGGV